jgi:hypothetical protein
MSRKYKSAMPQSTLHMAADSSGVFALEEGVKLGEDDEVDVGVSRCTEELNNLRVSVQGLIRSWIDYSGIKLGHDRWGKRNGPVQPLASADLDKISDNTFTAIRTLALKALAACATYKEEDLVTLEGVDMLKQFCNVLSKVNMQKDCAPGIVLAIRWFYCDGLVRNLRLRKQHRADGLQQWRQALFEASKLIEAIG